MIDPFKYHTPSAAVVHEATQRYLGHESKRYRVERSEGSTNRCTVIDGEAERPTSKAMCITTYDNAERIARALNIEDQQGKQ